jgi:hypothetical protein
MSHNLIGCIYICNLQYVTEVIKVYHFSFLISDHFSMKIFMNHCICNEIISSAMTFTHEQKGGENERNIFCWQLTLDNVVDQYDPNGFG